jgi:hypothetical protein
MPSEEFEAAFPISELPQTRVLDCTATGIKHGKVQRPENADSMVRILIAAK